MDNSRAYSTFNVSFAFLSSPRFFCREKILRRDSLQLVERVRPRVSHLILAARVRIDAALERDPVC